MAVILAVLAVLLPLAPHPALPFPSILTDAPVFTSVAPGVQYGDYEMLTVDGPLSIHVAGIDVREPTIRIGSVLAQERLVSDGETVSSMAHRSGAIVGINGDYFDINQTNQPLNILIENGRLTRMPMHRWAIAFDNAKRAAFAEFSIQPFVHIGATVHSLKTIDDWPPPGGGAVLITPWYGQLKPVENVTEIALQPVNGSPPLSTYRVTGIVDNTRSEPAGYYLAVGLNAYGSIGVPDIGETVSIDALASPPLQGLQTAIGGGPLLVKDGLPYSDPDGPSGGEFATHMPASAVAVTRDGRLLLFEIDGRQPALSIGVLQPQLAALLIAFGAVTGMQLDGGGSSTIVTRMPGDATASVENSPSDGMERRVADGLFVYSDAPSGPPARIVARPQTIRALPGARVALRFAVTDAAGHAVPAHLNGFRLVRADLGTLQNDVFTAGQKTGDGFLAVRDGALRLDVPISVTNRVARAEILPQHPQVREFGTVQLTARAFDRNGYAIAVPDSLPWTADSGRIDRSGFLRAQTGDVRAGVRLGDAFASGIVTVGEHAIELPLSSASFSTAPLGGPGSLSPGELCAQCATLRYDFTGDERAAYLNLNRRLQERALGISADVYGDGNGETLRVAVTNAINERFLYTVARVDWRGWRRVEVRFPPELPQPLTLKALYVINRVGPEPPVHAAGAIGVRDVRLLLAGSSAIIPNSRQP